MGSWRWTAVVVGSLALYACGRDKEQPAETQRPTIAALQEEGVEVYAQLLERMEHNPEAFRAQFDAIWATLDANDLRNLVLMRNALLEARELDVRYAFQRWPRGPEMIATLQKFRSIPELARLYELALAETPRVAPSRSESSTPNDGSASARGIAQHASALQSSCDTDCFEPIDNETTSFFVGQALDKVAGLAAAKVASLSGADDAWGAFSGASSAIFEDKTSFLGAAKALTDAAFPACLAFAAAATVGTAGAASPTFIGCAGVGLVGGLLSTGIGFYRATEQWRACKDAKVEADCWACEQSACQVPGDHRCVGLGGAWNSEICAIAPSENCYQWQFESSCGEAAQCQPSSGLCKERDAAPGKALLGETCTSNAECLAGSSLSCLMGADSPFLGLCSRTCESSLECFGMRCTMSGATKVCLPDDFECTEQGGACTDDLDCCTQSCIRGACSDALCEPSCDGVPACTSDGCGVCERCEDEPPDDSPQDAGMEPPIDGEPTAVDGTWSGPYDLTINDTSTGCTFQHEGIGTLQLAGSSGTYQVTGIQILIDPGCMLKEVRTIDGSLTSVRVAGSNVDFMLDDIVGSGTVVGNTFAGTLSNPEGSGSFTFTRQ